MRKEVLSLTELSIKIFIVVMLMSFSIYDWLWIIYQSVCFWKVQEVLEEICL